MKSTYDQLRSTNDITTTNSIVAVPDRFDLRAFSRLAYDQDISGPPVASSLLGLLEHYTMLCNIKSINIRLLCSHFHEFALNGYNQTRDGDNFVVLWRQTDTPSSLLDDYFARGACLQNFGLYDYVPMINIIPRRKRQPNDIQFADHYRNAKSYMQRYITKGKPFLVKLFGRFYDDINNDKNLSIDDSNSMNDNIALVLLGLFVP